MGWNADDPNLIQEYLVQVAANSSNDQPTTEISETNKNYFCKWQENGKEKTDKNCEIKQIKFDSDKKPVLLSDIMKSDNSSSSFETTITKEKIKTQDTWFLLKITSYNFDLSADWNAQQINIDILSTTYNKKYIAITPRFKLKNNKTTQGTTNLFLVKYKNNIKPTQSTSSLTYCRYTLNNSTYAGKCDVYNLSAQPTSEPITSLDLTGASKITDASSMQNDNCYIIYFNDSLFSISDLMNVTISIYENDSSNDKKAEFAAIHPIISKTTISTFPTTSENLILLN